MAKVYFRYGTMKSGKSIDVIRAFDSYEKTNRKAIVIKPAIDTRDKGVVRTRKGYEINAIIIKDEKDLLNLRDEISFTTEIINAIIVDEVQFFNENQIKILISISDEMDIPLLCYGLKTDFNGKLFDGSKTLLELADNIEEVKTVCQFCERKATMNLRTFTKNGVSYTYTTDNNTNNISIGDEEYIQVCRRCYNKSIKNGKV